MSSGVNQNINRANHVKWRESQYRWSKSHQVLCSLVKPNIGFFSHVYGAKPEIEGVNHVIDGVKFQAVEYFVV